MPIRSGYLLESSVASWDHSGDQWELRDFTFPGFNRACKRYLWLHRLGGRLHHTIGIAVSPVATGDVLAELEALDGVVQLSIERGVSVKPSGDLITAHVLNRDVDAVLAIADSARAHGSVSVTTAEAQSMVDEHSARAIDNDIDEAPWEEIERGLRHHGRFNWNFAALRRWGRRSH